MVLFEVILIFKPILFFQIKSEKSKDATNCPEMDYFMNESVSDVVFLVEGQRLPALKVLLSIKSKVFRAMFSGHFRECEVKEVVIEDTTYEAFKTFVQFLYCERLVLKDCNDFKLIEEVCQLSDRYDVNRILEKVDEHLMAMTLSWSDSVTFKWISKIAFDHNLPNVKSKVLTHIDQHFNDFIWGNHKNLVELDVFTHNHLVEVFAQNYCKLQSELCRVNRDFNYSKQNLNTAQTQLDRYAKLTCKYCGIINLRSSTTCQICNKPITPY